MPSFNSTVYMCLLKLCSVKKVVRQDGQENFDGGVSSSWLTSSFTFSKLLSSASIRTLDLQCSLCLLTPSLENDVNSHPSHLKLEVLSSSISAWHKGDNI